MGVEFNFNEKSFEKKLRKEVKKNALNASYDFTCPNCQIKCNSEDSSM